MYKFCEACKIGYHTPNPLQHTCGRTRCIEHYRWVHDINLTEGRHIKKFRSQAAVNKNIENVVRSAREVGMDYGTYMAYKERGWKIKNQNVSDYLNKEEQYDA